jgi:hypothetical protein
LVAQVSDHVCLVVFGCSSSILWRTLQRPVLLTRSVFCGTEFANNVFRTLLLCLIFFLTFSDNLVLFSLSLLYSSRGIEGFLKTFIGVFKALSRHFLLKAFRDLIDKRLLYVYD